MKDEHSSIDLSARDLNGIDVLPALQIQLIIDNGVTENKSYLAFRHAGFQLVDHRLGDDVPLLNSDAIYAGKLEGRTAGGQ